MLFICISARIACASLVRPPVLSPELSHELREAGCPCLPWLACSRACQLSECAAAIACAPWRPSADVLCGAGRLLVTVGCCGGAQGRTAFYTACLYGHLPIVHLLAERKASLDTRDLLGDLSTLAGLSYVCSL